MSRVRELNGTAAAVLAYLRDGPQSGWDIARGLQELVGDFWNVTPSQVYRELASMAEAGLVRAGPAGRRDRRPYTIRRAGRAALDAWLARGSERDVVRIQLLLRLFLAFNAGALDPERLAETLRPYRAEHQAQLDGYRRKYEELAATGQLEAHLVGYGVHYEEGVLAWLDSLPWK